MLTGTDWGSMRLLTTTSGIPAYQCAIGYYVWVIGLMFLICIKPRLHDTTCCQSRLSNRFENRVNVCIYDTTGCQTRFTTGLTNGCIVYTAGRQTGCTTRFDNRLYRVYIHLPGCQTGCQSVSCKRGFTFAVFAIFLCS